ncbi:xanthine dehydrogenase family protein molybdopterin-binding subunit [Catellatospora bangladeshensis]|uniref:Aldehyde oxidase n=1 Tax=Catellatospora bangladeshensis TaxID=310355 RepID=A0A8J3JYS9_9ACTN|nr:molybdopterin cofactor-binding domain-containing protein [Catellatospora bangladeshensis]GIF85494.1 aldehyde oxidase [Catellatospora bangladeshensis]
MTGPYESYGRRLRRRATRRRLLIGAGATVGALVVGVPLAVEYGRPALAEWMLGRGTGPAEIPESSLVWFELTGDGVTVYVPKIEMGQGVHTALAQIAAEELRVPPERLAVVQADTARGFPAQTLFTFGSTSVASLYTPIREAAAAVREMLALEAARQLGVDAKALTAADGAFQVSGTGRRLAYGEVISAHSGPWQEPPKQPELRPVQEFTSIGRSAPRVDFRAKLLGEAVYGYDARLPDMGYGAYAVPPRFGAELLDAQPGDAAGMPGVQQVVIDLPAGFAGVVADTRTRAWAALNALRLRWSEGSRTDTAAVEEQVTASHGVVLRRDGSISRALAEGTRVEAAYRTPLAAHAHLEPLAALARVEPGAGGRVELWVPTQSPGSVVEDVRAALGEQREVVLHVTQLGGSFGRKGGQHLAVAAARLSAAAGRPVHVGWTRDTDMRQGFYRPPTHTVMRGSVGTDGRIRGVEQVTAAGDIIWAVAGLPEPVRDLLGFDPGGLLGLFLPYELPAYRLVNRREQLPVPTGPWRGLGLMPNTFALESFVDELAEAAGADPLEFRLAHLSESDPEARRLRTVLRTAAQMARWGEPLPPGRGRGIACSGDVGTVVAMVAEVDLSGGRLRVTGMDVAVDCGLVVNPAGAKLQAQGSVVMGLSSALREELRIEDGQVVSDNFDSYPIIDMASTPPIRVTFTGDGEVPQGMGEPVIGPVPAAVANAVRAAGGPRLRTLPLRP